jgi:hypothetical protein
MAAGNGLRENVRMWSPFGDTWPFFMSTTFFLASASLTASTSMDNISRPNIDPWNRFIESIGATRTTMFQIFGEKNLKN